MRIEAQSDDSPEFVSAVEQTTRGIFHQVGPSTLLLMKIDNWFGFRWLGFCGKLLGIAGVHCRLPKARARQFTIPPFVPARVVSQRRFVAPDFQEQPAGEPLHKSIPSSKALRRKAVVEIPDTAMIWFSGGTANNDRGSLMVYMPIGAEYWAWYVAFRRTDSGWTLSELRGITKEQLRQFQSSSHLALVR